MQWERSAGRGPQCYRSWQGAAELSDGNLLMNEDFDEKSMRGFSEPVTQVQGGGWRKEKKIPQRGYNAVSKGNILNYR